MEISKSVNIDRFCMRRRTSSVVGGKAQGCTGGTNYMYLPVKNTASFFTVLKLFTF